MSRTADNNHFYGESKQQFLDSIQKLSDEASDEISDSNKKSESQKKIITIFNITSDYEIENQKDLSDFSDEELTEIFLSKSWITCDIKRNVLYYINKYAEFMGKPQKSLPEEEELKTLYSKRNIVKWVMSDEELFKLMREIIRDSGCIDECRFDMPMIFYLLSFYGIPEKEVFDVKKSFTKNFELPNGEVITNEAIKTFIAETTISGGYRYDEDRTKYRRYINTDSLISRSVPVKSERKKVKKNENDGVFLRQLQVQFNAICKSEDDRLTLKNIQEAGKFLRIYRQDDCKNDVILRKCKVKQQKGNWLNRLTQPEKEKYNIYKLCRLERGI